MRRDEAARTVAPAPGAAPGAPPGAPPDAPPDAPPAPTPPAPEAAAHAAFPPPRAEATVAAAAPAPAVLAVPAAGAAARPATVAAPRAPGETDRSRLEEMVGSVWLQSAGSILVLLGVFFLILWGYTTGRFGPGVLVVAGVALGVTLAWRGDRMARRLPPFGHALIGVGVGTVYLSLYLGHFTLRVLPLAAAFALLTLASIGSVLVGLRYRVQTIAALGVLGAFVPQLMAAWVPLRGFAMSASGMLGYLAAVDGVVFLLAARAGWSSLDLACLFLSAVTWSARFPDAAWGWPIQVGLSVLFLGLGLSPLPRLASREGTVRPIDLAVIALAPLCLIASSWPLLASAAPLPGAMLLLALAAIYLAAALWADARRPERDLWRPLTGAAVLFVTAGIERVLGRERTPMAWCLEGTLLMWLGLRARGGWLRACGYVVLFLGVFLLLLIGHPPGDWDQGQWPGLYADGVRDLACIVATLGAAWLLARGREHLAVAERVVPELWAAVGNLLIVIWTAREALHLGLALESPGGRWAHARDPMAPPGSERVNTVGISAMALFWMIQSAVLVALSRRPARGFLRVCGYVTGAIAALTVLISSCLADGWSSDQAPALYPTGLLRLASIALMAAVATGLAGRREYLGHNERTIPEVVTLVASLLLLGWTAIEARHLARMVVGVPGVYAQRFPGVDPQALRHGVLLGASFTSAGWLAEALVLLALGWARQSAFLRWSGLALTGITVLKFLLLDLQAVDVFWRFLTAIVVGVALLGVSYAYQRRSRAARGNG